MAITADKTGWGPGPWQDEPDTLQWVDEPTGLHCLIVRNMFGALCGYVGVPPEHLWHGTDYNEILDLGRDDDPSESQIEVHGGLTYSGPMNVRERVGPENLWWFGFDCAHAFDIQPGLEAKYGPTPLRGTLGLEWTYKNIDYVRRECAGLAAQLAGLVTGKVI